METRKPLVCWNRKTERSLENKAVTRNKYTYIRNRIVPKFYFSWRKQKKKKLKASFCNKIDLIEFYFSFFSFYFYPTFATKTFQFTRFFLPCTLSIQKFFSILSISIAIKKKKEQSLQNFSDDKSFKSTWRNISKYFTIAIDKSPRKKYIFRLNIPDEDKKKKKRKEGYFNARSTRELTRWKI